MDTYADTLTELMELFYQFKNETLDLVNDEELLNFMEEQFKCSEKIQYSSILKIKVYFVSSCYKLDVFECCNMRHKDLKQ